MIMRRRAGWIGWGLAVGVLTAGLGATTLDNPEDVKQLKATKTCTGCNFQDAQLPAVNVENGNVRNSDFRGAHLYRAIFRGADLTNAQFAGADLNAADLRAARGANLSGATTTARTICPDGSAGPCR